MKLSRYFSSLGWVRGGEARSSRTAGLSVKSPKRRARPHDFAKECGCARSPHGAGRVSCRPTSECRKRSPLCDRWRRILDTEALWGVDFNEVAADLRVRAVR